MRNLLVAIKESSMDGIKAVRKLGMYGFDPYYKNGPKHIVRMAGQRDLDYAIPMAPEAFKVKQG